MDLDDASEEYDEEFVYQTEETTDSEESLIYQNDFELNDTFIVIFEVEDDYVDKLLTIREIVKEDKKLILLDEEENEESLSLDDDFKILLKTNDYTIYDIEKVEEFDLDNLDSVELLLTQEIYPEIELDVEEVKEKIYSLQEKKESLLTELISIYGAYDNETVLQQLSDITEYFVKLIQIDKSESSNTLEWIRNMKEGRPYQIPQWIIPIVENKKVLYKLKDEDLTENEDIVIENFESMLEEKYKLMNIKDDQNSYRNIINTLQKFSPFKNGDSIVIPYHGMYLRFCDQTAQCNGIQKLFPMEINQTKNEHKIAVTKDQKTFLDTLTPKEQISILGFYTLPSSFLNITLNQKNLSIHELYYMSEYIYSHKLLKDRIKEEMIIPHMMQKDSIRIDEELSENIHSYLFNDKELTINEFAIMLENNLPTYSDIIDMIPKDVKQLIFNYKDFKKVYLSYDIDFHSLDKDNRTKLNDLIKTNIRRSIQQYNRSVKRKVIKNIKKKVKLLSTKEKIKLSKDFIMSQHVIPVRNTYLQKFIDVFGREPLANENINFIYEKNSPDILLCKHYLYEKNTHKDESAFNVLRSVFGNPPENGTITCKICGNYLCPENFSLLEGFSDGTPTISKEELVTDDSELQLLNTKQIEIKKRIKKITSLFGIQLNQYDQQMILDYYEVFNNESLINTRYGYENSFNKHPTYKEIKGKYKFIKPAKVKKDQIKNKENKELMKKEYSILKDYMIDCNEVLINLFLILFLIQTSIPSYPINSKFSVHLWKFVKEERIPWEEVQKTLPDQISMETIDTMNIIVRKIISYNKKDPFWKNILDFLNESTVFKDLPSFNQQFINVASFILKNSSIKKKLKEYYLLQNDQQTVFLKEYWATYKPLQENKIVSMINETIDKETKNNLLKTGTEINYENISSILPIEVAYVTPRYEYLKIPFSEIMKNEAYERLFKYSIHLHGVSKPFPIINLLIQNFIDTIKDKSILTTLSKIGWNSSQKSLTQINYSDFKNVFIVNLTEYFKKKNPEDRDTINIYTHIHLNNWNGMLLNGTPKRKYSYVLPVIFPDKTYEELLSEDNGTLIKQLFKNYCLNENDEINERYSIDQFITNLLADPSIEREAICDQLLVQTSENFYRILDFKRKSTMLTLIDETIYNHSFEFRMNHFIEINQLLAQNADPVFPILDGLTTIQKDIETEYRKGFSSMIEYNSSCISKLQEFLKGEFFEKDQIKRFNSSFGRSLDSFQVLLNRLLENTEKIPLMINHMMKVLSRLSHRGEVQGTVFHNHIPKQWKLSETNKDYFKEYLSYNEFLQHNDIFIPRKKESLDGFYKYQKEKNYTLCFQGLLTYLQEFYKEGYNTLLGDDESNFTEEYGNIFNRFNFLFLSCKIIDYIEGLKDESSPVSNQAIVLFTSLQDQERLELDDSIRLCSQFLFDIMIDLLESFTDTNWIYQTEQLSDKLSRQKEREKQEIIDNLENKTSDERLVTVQQQQCGLSNYYHTAIEKNYSHLESGRYKEQLDDERIAHMKELLIEQDAQREVLEANGIDSDHQQPPVPQDEQEDAYAQHDQDREDEGDDDGDNDGDYREN